MSTNKKNRTKEKSTTKNSEKMQPSAMPADSARSRAKDMDEKRRGDAETFNL